MGHGQGGDEPGRPHRRGAGARTALTSTPANLHVQHGRALVDAIAVGSGTVLVDDPLLTARDVYRDRPLTRVVFDRRLRTPPSARLFTTLDAGPVVILTSAATVQAEPARAAGLRRAGATLIEVPGPGLRAALECLPALDVHSIEIEGGAAIHAAAWDEGVVDAVQLYVAPVWLGPRRGAAVLRPRARPDDAGGSTRGDPGSRRADRGRCSPAWLKPSAR